MRAEPPGHRPPGSGRGQGAPSKTFDTNRFSPVLPGGTGENRGCPVTLLPVAIVPYARRRHLMAALALLAAALFTAGCAQALRDVRGRAAPVPPPAVFLEGVPFFPGGDELCGPAALASVLAYHGAEVTMEEISAAVYEPRIGGSLMLDMLVYAGRVGMEAVFFDGTMGDVGRLLREGYPVILFLNLGLRAYPVGHFVVVTGMDERRGVVVLHTGRKAHEAASVEEIGSAWKRGGGGALLVRPPLPGDGTALAEYLRRASELVGQGRFEQARRVVSRALLSYPGNPLLLNDLAWTLMELGRLDEAGQTAAEALERDPSRRHVYLDTMGVVHTRLGLYERAERELSEALDAAAASGADPKAKDLIEAHLMELYRERGREGAGELRRPR